MVISPHTKKTLDGFAEGGKKKQEQLKEIQDYIGQLLGTTEAAPAPPKEQRKPKKVSVVKKYVSCNYKNCKCHHGKKHGPYLYECWREKVWDEKKSKWKWTTKTRYYGKA